MVKMNLNHLNIERFVYLHILGNPMFNDNAKYM